MMIESVAKFLAQGPFAVVGASTNPEKFGNKILRCYQEHKLEVYPINPRAESIEGLRCYPSLEAIPAKIRAISVITPPKITLGIVTEAAALGISWIWMQPGAESKEAVRHAEELGLVVISGGPCLLVELGCSHS